METEYAISGERAIISLPIGREFSAEFGPLLAYTDFLHSYINFAHGDEDLDVVYGPSLSRLQALKKKYDPNNVFNHWFPLTPRSQSSIEKRVARH